MKKRAWAGRVGLVTGAPPGSEKPPTTLANMGASRIERQREDRLQALAKRLGGETMVVPADLRDIGSILSCLSGFATIGAVSMFSSIMRSSVELLL